MIPKSTSFHTGTGLPLGGTNDTIKLLNNIFVNRSVTYRFFPHFHPYVPSLIDKLNEGGIAGLQDADTEYQPGSQPNTLAILPNSTRATLQAAVQVTMADGTSATLGAGTAFTLADGAFVTVTPATEPVDPNGLPITLAGNASVQLPGDLPLFSWSGNQWQIGGVQTIVPESATVILSGSTPAALAGDGTAVTLPAQTSVLLGGGSPLPVLHEEIFTTTSYNPNPQFVQEPYPTKDLDFTSDGAYSVYNWELFFHAPLLIAVHLSQNQKFQDAQDWFHYIFNPTDNSIGPTPQRFWKVQPFQTAHATLIEQILVNLSTKQDPELRQQTIKSINSWKQNPFQPWVIAQYRPTACMLKTVMAYLDNLIAWGDSLFQQYTIETINEATQVYVLAADILGPKPQAVPVQASAKPLTYNDIRGQLDAFSNALVDMEVDIPFDSAPPPAAASPGPQGTQILTSVGQTLFFCLPQNDQLMAYWDTVADRLFKIHNSLNFQGVFQRLPLFDPPIDPALLTRAAAAGLDVSAIVSGLNQPLPLVRFNLLVSKAAEICQEVKSLGANLLAAMEKQDNESLTLLRARHENIILDLAETVKYSQWQDATKARQGLEQSLANATQRYTYYQKLLGRTDSQISVPSADPLDAASLQNLNFSQTDSSSEPQMPMDAIQVSISQDSLSVSDGEIKTLSPHEAEELDDLSSAQTLNDAAVALDAISATMNLMPGVSVNVEPWGIGATLSTGPSNFTALLNAVAVVARGTAAKHNYDANKSSKLGSYDRRELEWTFQSNSAKGEINQVFKQLRGAQIREAIAQKEFENHQVQMQHAQEIVDFLQGNNAPPNLQIKETTVGFYAWMKREVKGLYAKSFQLAFEVAKKAERALQNELGDPSQSYIQYNYLDGTEGLLAGEKLLFDVKSMEIAYHDLNQREYELTKHVSLLQVAPLALVQLRATGACTVELPEGIFDLDCPGHFFRRIKSVAVSIPCVAGPYVSVNCTLTLQKSSIRRKADTGTAYARTGDDDQRFDDYFGAIQSIVTSSGQSDSGLFETNFHDERYLPFEAAGAISQWRLMLPRELPQFDFDTITDVILHLRYTAREGGSALRSAAVQTLQAQFKSAQSAVSVRLFSIRHEFPTEWAKFVSADLTSAPTAALALNLQPKYYPFWAQGMLAKGSVKHVQFFAEMSDTATSVNVWNAPVPPAPPQKPDSLVQDPQLQGLLSGTLSQVPNPPLVVADPTQPYTLYLDDNAMKNLWMALTWGGA